MLRTTGLRDVARVGIIRPQLNCGTQPVATTDLVVGKITRLRRPNVIAQPQDS